MKNMSGDGYKMRGLEVASVRFTPPSVGLPRIAHGRIRIVSPVLASTLLMEVKAPLFRALRLNAQMMVEAQAPVPSVT